MSLHFDLVITCDFREDTPAACIELISWLCDENSEAEKQPSSDCLSEHEKELLNVWPHAFLASDTDQEIISVFARRHRYNRPENVGGGEVHKYGFQFSARDILDDEFYDCHLSFCTGWPVSAKMDT